MCLNLNPDGSFTPPPYPPEVYGPALPLSTAYCGPMWGDDHISMVRTFQRDLEAAGIPFPPESPRVPVSTYAGTLFALWYEMIKARHR